MDDQLGLWGTNPPRERLRWSVSRHKRLEACVRRYYLTHFGTRGAHLPDALPQTKELAMLRALRNRYMWVGEIVHQLVETAMSTWRRGDGISLDTLIARGTLTMRAQFAQSRSRAYREKPMQCVGFMEHEYEEDVSDQEWAARREHMVSCMRHFFKLDLIREVRTLPRWRWLAVEDFGSFEHHGATIIVRPDFAWRDPNGQVVMVDWKTGMVRIHDEDLQLAVYGIFARRAWGLGGHSIRAVVVYLSDGQTRTRHITVTDLEAAEGIIESSVQHMQQLAPDKGIELHPSDLDARYPMTQNLSTCTHCNFKRPCGRILKTAVCP